MIIDAIQHYAVATPLQLALVGSHMHINYAELSNAIELAKAKLKQSKPRVLGIAMDNSPAWAVMDLAAISLNICVVPLPLFFSAEQLAHAINDAGIDLIVCDEPLHLERVLHTQGMEVGAESHYLVAGKVLTEFRLASEANLNLPAGTAKVTYTSGTTGKPKGVCLSLSTIETVAKSLQEATQAQPKDRHLSILPLSTLLENIAGLYVPLMAGATAVLYGAQQVGLSGATGFDVQKMMQALHTNKATTLILTPELLNALVSMVEAGYPVPEHLRFVAVGGASVSPKLLDRAQALALPVFEGYGLSECASVVALNTVQANQIGSVGKPLPHVTVRFAEDGEILVSGNRFLSYLGSTHSKLLDAWPTGDIGYMDASGYLYITGRKKNMFITSYGRNVAPEWVERELTLMPAIAQAALFGEAKPFNVAVIVPRPQASAESIQAAIECVNQGLPDYARVTRWITASAAFTPQNDQMTANYRLKREAIWQHYQQQLNALYEETSHAVL